MERRSFIRNTGIAAAALAVSPWSIATNIPPTNKLPKWKGFNLLDFFNPDPANSRPPVHFKLLRKGHNNTKRAQRSQCSVLCVSSCASCSQDLPPIKPSNTGAIVFADKPIKMCPIDFYENLTKFYEAKFLITVK